VVVSFPEGVRDVDLPEDLPGPGRPDPGST